MADIDQILAGGAGAGSRYDFSTIADPTKAFFDANKQRAEFDQRRLFKEGVPLDPATGQPDFAAISKALFGSGALNEGLAASKVDLERQKLKAGMEMAARDFPSGPAPSAPAPAPAAPSIVSPPSSNRGASVAVAPPLAKGNSGSPQGDQPGSIVGLVSGAGIPDELAGPIIAQVSASTRTDPNATLSPDIAPRVQQAIQAAAQRMKAGQPSQPVAPAAPTAPTAPAAASVSDTTLGGLVPPGRTPAQQLELLSRSVASGFLAPEVAKVYEARIKALQDALQPTTEMKNAQATGKTLEAYQARTDEETSRREVLTKSVLPKLDKSQEQANAARDEIQAIHRSREQLDAPGGIFSGTAADIRLKLAKVADYLGVPNADKINNTEAFGSAIGSRTLALVKGLGAGAGISNADRDFAAAMAGGNIKLDEKSIRRILDIGEKAARIKIQQHNGLVDRSVASSEALKEYKDVYRTEAPGEYKKAAAATDPFEKARAAIAAGAPRDAVAARLKQSGYDPSKL